MFNKKLILCSLVSLMCISNSALAQKLIDPDIKSESEPKQETQIQANSTENQEKQQQEVIEESKQEHKYQLEPQLNPKTPDIPIEAEEPAFSKDDYLTRDWWGARSKMAEHGVYIDVTYTAEPFFKTHGGLTNHSKMKYLGLVDYSLTLNTKEMGLWRGGTFFVLGQNLHGHGLTEQQIGDMQTVSSIDAPGMTQLSEYWFEQEIIPDRLKIKIGKQDANADFSILELSEDYINSSFTLNPTIPMPTYPDPALGAVIYARPYKGFTLKAGVFDGEGDGGQLGFNTAFDGEGGTFVIVEPAIEHSIKNLYGKFLAGFWYHSGDVDEITDDPNPRLLKSHYGFYGSFQQMLFKENKDEEDQQGLSIMGSFGWTPSKANELSAYYGAGLAYKGAIPYRDNDVAGIGVAIADLSRRVFNIDGRTSESALEIFYKFQVTPYLVIQPDLQYIFSVNGEGTNAMMIGVRTIINF